MQASYCAFELDVICVIESSEHLSKIFRWKSVIVFVTIGDKLVTLISGSGCLSMSYNLSFTS
eukprot:11656534-Karenia_brevis.AAC.1